MSIRKLSTGKWQVDIQNQPRGIERIRRNFLTKKEAQEYEAAVRSEAHDNLLGRRKRHLFGQALTRYMTEISPHKKDHKRTLRLVAALRWPVWTGERWISLEHIPLETPPGQLGIILAMQHWRTDMLAIHKRVYLDNRTWHQRKTPKGLAWYEQPAAVDGNMPAHRTLVIDPARLAQLETQEGRGPYSPQTLRTRQALVRSVLKCAYQQWDWLNADIRGKILLESVAGNGRQLYLQDTDLAALVNAAKKSDYGIHFAHLIIGAALIGWRKSNILDLQWSEVVFPIYDQTGAEIQCGYITVAAEDVKTNINIGQPMSADVLQLLTDRWTHRNGLYVFHQGNGKPFKFFRRAWESAKKRAGIDPELRWHDLRHTSASRLIQAGASDRHLMELFGWKSTAMAKTYAHLRVEHLQAVVNLPNSIMQDIN